MRRWLRGRREGPAGPRSPRGPTGTAARACRLGPSAASAPPAPGPASEPSWAMAACARAASTGTTRRCRRPAPPLLRTTRRSPPPWPRSAAAAAPPGRTSSSSTPRTPARAAAAGSGLAGPGSGPRRCGRWRGWSPHRRSCTVRERRGGDGRHKRVQMILNHSRSRRYPIKGSVWYRIKTTVEVEDTRESSNDWPHVRPYKNTYLFSARRSCRRRDRKSWLALDGGTNLKGSFNGTDNPYLVLRF